MTFLFNSVHLFLVDTIKMNKDKNAPKRARRYHSPEFKARIVGLCQTSGKSRAAIAREYDLNDNLIQKWCQKAKRHGLPAQPTFIELPAPKQIPSPRSVNGPSDSVLFELMLPAGAVSVRWPLTSIEQSISWLKALSQ